MGLGVKCLKVILIRLYVCKRLQRLFVCFKCGLYVDRGIVVGILVRSSNSVCMATGLSLKSPRGLDCYFGYDEPSVEL